MSYIVPNEVPKTCGSCPYSHLIFQNPCSSTTPVKRFRCQTGEAPWRIIEIDYYDKDYKDKDCPLIAYNVDKVVEELERSEDISKCEYLGLEDESARGAMCAYASAIEIVKKGGVDHVEPKPEPQKPEPPWKQAFLRTFLGRGGSYGS